MSGGLTCKMVDRFAEAIEDLSHPAEVVRLLEDGVAAQIGLGVYCLWQVPFGDERALQYRRGRNYFPGPSVPEEYWTEFWPLVAMHGPSLFVRYARAHPAPFTWGEATRTLRPRGTDRWAIDILHKNGMLEGLHCPHNQYLVAFFSRDNFKPTRHERVALNQAAGLAVEHYRRWAMRPKNLDRRPELSPNETKALLWYSLGDELDEIAQRLGSAKGSVETHLDRARLKLNAKTRAHAVRIAALKGDI